MDFLELAKKRYSTRSFSDKKTEEADLGYILEAGRCANSAKNLQPQIIYVAESDAALAAVNESARVYGAPTVLVCCARKSAAWESPFTGRNSAETDVAICMTHMELAAAARGVGSVWICRFDEVKLHAALSLPSDVTIFGLLALGYADGTPASEPSPRHADRKPLDETVKRI